MQFCIRSLGVGLVFALCLSSRVASAGESVVLGTTTFPPLVVADGTGYMDLLLKEAFRRIGVDAHIENLPGGAALRMSNEGITDGEALRAAGVEREYPNLVQVPSPVLTAEWLAWSARDDVRLRDWSDLRSYVVGYALGWKVYDREVKQAAEIVRVRSLEQLLPLLANGRLDVALLDRWQALYLAKQGGWRVHPVEPALARLDMYTYLNVKHREKVGPLAKALADMKADGATQRIFDKTLAPYLAK